MPETKRLKTVSPIIILTLILGIYTSAHSQQTGSQMDQPQTRAAIEGIAAKLADGLVKHDADALAALFSVDGILVSPFGVQVGRQAIQQSYPTLTPEFKILFIISRLQPTKKSLALQLSCGAVLAW
jgi:hypothetical protein